MSSNKNLKVYKMVFLTHLQKLTMSVKFACKMKATWKRSTSRSRRQLVGRDRLGASRWWKRHLRPDPPAESQHVLRHGQEQIRRKKGKAEEI